MKGLQKQTLEVGEPFYGLIDLEAEEKDLVQVEVQTEIVGGGNHKLYIHVNGQTVVRISKLRSDQVEFKWQ